MPRFILYVHRQAGGAGRRLLKSVLDKFPDIEQENCDDVEDLHKRLCLPACDGKEKDIVVVFVDNGQRLEQLIERKGCLDSRRLVLVLCEMSREMLSRSHLLRPRYVSFGKNRFSDLLSVLEKMIDTPGQRDLSGDNEQKTEKENS